MKEIESQI
jgi:hypothetical protein